MKRSKREGPKLLLRFDWGRNGPRSSKMAHKLGEPIRKMTLWRSLPNVGMNCGDGWH